jgi:F0F1-type ATP synthase delta subunit
VVAKRAEQATVETEKETPMTDEKRTMLEAIIDAHQRIFERTKAERAAKCASAEDLDRAEIELLEAKLRLLEG